MTYQKTIPPVAERNPQFINIYKIYHYIHYVLQYCYHIVLSKPDVVEKKMRANLESLQTKIKKWTSISNKNIFGSKCVMCTFESTLGDQIWFLHKREKKANVTFESRLKLPNAVPCSIIGQRLAGFA